MKENIHIPDERIMACATFGQVLDLCWRVSGRGLQEVAWDCGWRDSGKHLSSILRDEARRHMPGEKLVPYMMACGNLAPLRWYELRLNPDLVVGAVAAELAEVKGALAELRDMLRHVVGQRPQYSTTGCARRRARLAPVRMHRAVACAERILLSPIVVDARRSRG